MPFDFIGIFPKQVISLLLCTTTPKSNNSTVVLESTNPLAPAKLNIGLYNNQDDLNTLVKGKKNDIK